MAYVYRKPKMWRTNAITSVIGDAPLSSLVFRSERRRNKSQENAQRRRTRPTTAERELETILNSLNGGILRGRFFREWAFADRWILDFFFHEIRLGIEVDGSIHTLPDQRKKDREKERTCDEWSITLLRITNREVLGNREQLLEKLRDGWRTAARRFKQSAFARLAP